MLPCLEGEGCDLLINRSGWTCTQPGGRVKTTTVRTQRCAPHTPEGEPAPGGGSPRGGGPRVGRHRDGGSWLGVETLPASLPPPCSLSSPPATWSVCPYCVRLSPWRGAQSPDRTSLKASAQKSAQSPLGWLVTLSRCWGGGVLRQEDGLGPPQPLKAL